MKQLFILILALLAVSAFCDTSNTITLSNSDLATAESKAKAETAKAANVAKTIKKIDIKISQDAIDIQKNLAKQAIAEANQTMVQQPTEYAPGQKYYINSPAFKTDAINQSKMMQSMTKQGSPAINFNETLKYYNQLSVNTKNIIGNNHLLIFVSYSIPKESFKRLIKDGAAVNAVFVFRGMINHSMKDTQKAFMEFRQNYNVGAEINPKLFKAFNINVVPAFVVYKNGDKDILAQACDIAPEYSKITGDITVRYALEQLKKSKSAALSQLSQNYLDRLDSQGFYNQKRTNQ